APISLRAGIEFLRAAPAAAEVLTANDLRSWGDLGRRLAMGDVENSVNFFPAGVGELRQIPAGLHPLVFQLCARQITLSSAVAVETLNSFPRAPAAVDDDELLSQLLEVASEIARRSAKHSSEFFNSSPEVIARLKQSKSPRVVDKGVELAAEFASRAGGIAADAWASLPSVLQSLSASEAL